MGVPPAREHLGHVDERLGQKVEVSVISLIAVNHTPCFLDAGVRLVGGAQFARQDLVGDRKASPTQKIKNRVVEARLKQLPEDAGVATGAPVRTHAVGRRLEARCGAEDVTELGELGWRHRAEEVPRRQRRLLDPDRPTKRPRCLPRAVGGQLGPRGFELDAKEPEEQFHDLAHDDEPWLGARRGLRVLQT